MDNPIVVGVVTAYGAAKRAGYTGTYEEFCAEMENLGIEVGHLENMTVNVNILEPSATASATYADGVLTLNLPKGDTGATGKSAYQYAVDGGYTGTEAEFTQLCADLGIEVGHLENMTVVVNQVASSVAPSATYVDGTLTINVPAATDAQVSSAADTWLAANVDPATGYVLDRTLTMENAAAPADLVGDLKSALSNNLDYNDIPQNIEKLALVNSQISDAATHGITLTKVGDTSFILNGTATGQTVTFNLDFNAVTLSEQMYYFFKRSDGLTSQSDVWMQMGFFNDSGVATQLTTITNFNTVIPFTFPTAAKKSRNYLRIGAGASFNNVRFDILAFDEMPLLQTVDTILDDVVDRYDSIMFLHPITSVGDQSIYVHSGDTIVINADSNTIATNAYIAPYIAGDPSVSIAVGSGTYRLTATKSGWLRLQNTSTVISANAYVESRFDAKIATIEQSIVYGGEVYTVKKDGTGDYTSFVACLKALSENTNKKTIFVYGGEYDVYEENGGDAYIASITNPSSMNWSDVNAIVPPNTSVIGVGNVVLKFYPTAEQIGSQDMAFLFAPLNVRGTCHIENIKIVAGNCRYGIHSETSSIADFNNAVHSFKNVTIDKEKGTYGLNPSVACGLGASEKIEWNNCIFKNDIGVCFTAHDNNSAVDDGALLTFNNCVFVKKDGSVSSGIIQLITGGGIHYALENDALFANCYIKGNISLTGGNSSTKQKFKVTSVGSTIVNGVTVDGTFSENPFPAEIY